MLARSDLRALLELANPYWISRSLWRQRDLVLQMVRREVDQKYRGSYLGILWSFISPLLMLTIYTFVFSMVFPSKWPTTGEMPTSQFALIIFSGLSAFNVFSEVANRSPGLILANPNYVKKVVFPLEVLPVIALGSALVTSVISVGLVVVGSLLVTRSISPTVVFLPMAYVPLILLSLTMGWLLSALGVYVRDVNQGIVLVTQVLFFLSPVFYPLSAVPARFRPLMQLNPMAFILEEFRKALVWGTRPDWSGWLIWVTVLGILSVFAYVWFMKSKKGFADVM